MRTILYFFIVLLCFTSCKNKSVTSKQQNTFQSIFNGKDLNGWRGDDTYWRVENGTLIGEVTPETILKQNSFIIYQNKNKIRLNINSKTQRLESSTSDSKK